MFASRVTYLACALIILAMTACEVPQEDTGARLSPEPPAVQPDPHSYSRPDEVVVRHLELDLTADFDTKRLLGSATVAIENLTGAEALSLDIDDLEIESIVLLPSGKTAAYSISADDAHMGSELRIDILPSTERVRIDYATDPGARALQWLEPSQTASEHPFLFTQSQAILARSWIPLQDTPGVRLTYSATLRVPVGLLAIMSATNSTENSPDGVYSFEMPQAIPSYLLALAIGKLEFRSLGPRSGVYAEPSIVDAAAWEFAEVEAMLHATEDLYGPYLWERYDLLVLPPSFPFGGMENPRLTFVTPTLLAGDRSLVNVVAHEIAHSWSGNLVTNATWNDFWLNEGFTSYVEIRIMELLRGPDYAEMLWGISLNELEREIVTLAPGSDDTRLYVDLVGRNPDDGMTSIAYEKGAAFLRRLEHHVGRARWDDFLIGYLDHFAFQSIDTQTFVKYLQDNLLSDEAGPGAPSIDAWIYRPALPDDYVRPQSEAFASVESELARWLAEGEAKDIDAADWSTQQWQHFLNELPEILDPGQLADLDATFGLTNAGNAEIRAAWYEVAIENDYAAAYPGLEEFLVTVGRRKFLKPLYEALAADEEGLAFARRVYARARPGYHPVSYLTVDDILEKAGRDQP